MSGRVCRPEKRLIRDLATRCHLQRRALVALDITKIPSTGHQLQRLVKSCGGKAAAIRRLRAVEQMHRRHPERVIALWDRNPDLDVGALVKATVYDIIILRACLPSSGKLVAAPIAFFRFLVFWLSPRQLRPRIATTAGPPRYIKGSTHRSRAGAVPLHHLQGNSLLVRRSEFNPLTGFFSTRIFANGESRARRRELDRLAADFFGRETGDVSGLDFDDCTLIWRDAARVRR